MVVSKQTESDTMLVDLESIASRCWGDEPALVPLRGENQDPADP